LRGARGAGERSDRGDTAMTGLTSTEIVIILAYLAGTYTLAIAYARADGRPKDVAGYFLAGRALPWYLIGISFYATNMSGASFVGLMGAAYGHGLTVFHYEWTAALVLVLFAAFILPVFLRSRLVTVTEYLEHRYDRRARLVYSAFTLLTMLLVDTAGALYAGSVVLRTVVPAVDLWLACLLLSLLAGLYTIVGGLRAVVVTDTIQALVLIMGAALVGYFALAAVGGWDALIEKSSDRNVTLFLPTDDSFLPWPGILGVVILGFYYWTFNQYFVQRALAARSLDDGRKGAIFGGLLKIPNLFLMIIPGMAAAVLYPALDSPDKVFPALAFELLPVGLRSIVLAAMMAAIMSSLDSALNAASSLVTVDFVRPRWPGLDQRALIRIGRVATTVIMLLAALYAPLIATFGSLFEYFQATLAYLVPPVVAVYLGGILGSRFSRESGFPALAIMQPAALVLFLAKEITPLWAYVGLPPIHFTYMAIAILCATLALMVLLSARTRAAGQRFDEAMLAALADMAPDATASGRGLLSDYRLHGAMLMGAVGLLLVLLA
jgi:solute:Na+ symporter, SSS family